MGKKKKEGSPAHSSDDINECAGNPFAPAGLNNNNWVHLLPLSEYNTENQEGCSEPGEVMDSLKKKKGKIP